MQKITNNFGSSSTSSSIGNMSSSGRHSVEEIKDDDHDHQEISRLAISNFQAREEEIERKKMEVKEKVELQLSRAEEETRRLAKIWEVSSLVF
ncbi:RAB6-interacting golgin [Parasponia andersonii]|uniref:RAB6-interacting golgin n=1 Tax=Parasponia andersonii TaxID=3476 RepID=A0A2P5C5K9_PARAD|nr:RAB6-interacting golgin [Parasponia andersonii]